MTTDKLYNQINRFVNNEVWHNISEEIYISLPDSLKKAFVILSKDDQVEQLGRRLHTTISWNLYQYDYLRTNVKDNT